MLFKSTRTRILIIHGPNLNLLGERESDIYGTLTLKQINRIIRRHAKDKSIRVRIFQSNHEGKILDIIHKNRKWARGIVINPAALTHTSIALHDAITGVRLPSVEVHLSDIQKREPFRKKSFLAPACIAQISGLKELSYIQGIDRILKYYR